MTSSQVNAHKLWRKAKGFPRKQELRTWPSKWDGKMRRSCLNPHPSLETKVEWGEGEGEGSCQPNPQPDNTKNWTPIDDKVSK